jgi:hypothetical protein
VQGRKLFARSTFPVAVLIGLALAAPAGAQELVDVAALESRLEAAGELAELPTDAEWGVAEAVGSDPTAAADAPPVPVESATEAPASEPSTTEAPVSEPPAVEDSEDAAAARYHAEEPQYHAEYHASEPAPATEAPPPAREPVVRPTKVAPEAALATVAAVAQAAQGEPAKAEPAPTESRATQPAAPPTSSAAPASAPTPVQDASTPVQEAPSATPTIWIWIWNWTWTTVADGRYHDSVDQYQIDESILGADVPKSVASSVRMPAQIDLQTGVDIVDKIQRGITPLEAVREAQREARAITLEATQEASLQARDLGVEADVPLAEVDAVLEETEAALERVFRPLRRSSAQPPTGAASVAVRAEARTTARAVRKRDAHAWTAVTSRSAHTRAHAHAQVASSSASYFASGDAAARSSRHAKRSAARPRMHRAAAPTPPLRTDDVRLTDAGSASGGGVGFLLKTIAVLTAFMLLAALGYGFRVWLPVTRLRGLLGTRTDPPG